MRALASTGMVAKQKNLLRFNFGQKSAYDDCEAVLLSGPECDSNGLTQVSGLEMSRIEHCIEHLYPHMNVGRRNPRENGVIREEGSSTAFPSRPSEQTDPKNAMEPFLDDFLDQIDTVAQDLACSRSQLVTPPRSEEYDHMHRQMSRTADCVMDEDGFARGDFKYQSQINEKPNGAMGQLQCCTHTVRSGGRLKRKSGDIRPSQELIQLNTKRRRLGIASGNRQGSPSGPGMRAVQAADEDDGCRYVRIGECVDDRALSEDGVDMRSIVVAIVDPAMHRAESEPQRVTYVAVDSYTINGISIGDFDSADRDISLAQGGFRADRYWRDQLRIRVSQGAACFGFSRHELNSAVIKYANQTPSGKRPRTGPRPRKTPVRLRHSLKSWSKVTKIDSRHTGEINAVIAFVNDVVDVDLGLPRNLQASLDYDESLTSFKRYILDQKGTYGSIEWMLTDDRSPIEVWADVSIWVLPTRRGRKARKMYEWTESSAKTAKDFLDPHSVQKYGRTLYIEVRIVEDPDAQRKDQERIRRIALSSADLLGPAKPPSRKMASARKWEKTWANGWRATPSRSHFSEKRHLLEPVNTAEKALGMRRDEWVDEDDEEVIIKIEPMVNVKPEDG